MPSYLCLAYYGLGLMRYQTGARTVRRAQEQAEPEYIRPGAATSVRAVTPAAPEIRWRKPAMGVEACSYNGLRLSPGGTAHGLLALPE